MNNSTEGESKREGEFGFSSLLEHSVSTPAGISHKRDELFLQKLNYSSTKNYATFGHKKHKPSLGIQLPPQKNPESLDSMCNQGTISSSLGGPHTICTLYIHTHIYIYI